MTNEQKTTDLLCGMTIQQAMYVGEEDLTQDLFDADLANTEPVKTKRSQLVFNWCKCPSCHELFITTMEYRNCSSEVGECTGCEQAREESLTNNL